jgi:hypothetical protein
MSLDSLGFGSPFDDLVDRFFGGRAERDTVAVSGPPAAEGEAPDAATPSELQQVGS